MNYPFWDIPIGYGYLMAAIAVVHVFISHFAIGGGLYLVLSEMRARKRGDSLALEYLQKLSKFFILLTLIAGALTGVGIWFVIGLLNPSATQLLINQFLWVWAIEWTFFAVEMTAALLYYYGWTRVSPRFHIQLGWIYFVAAWLSLFAINGIITFMLTPGEWISTGSLLDGFFNPTFWPSLVLRTGITLMLAGMWAMIVIVRFKDEKFRIATIRVNAMWGLAGLAIIAPSFYWYWQAIPAEVISELPLRMPNVISVAEHSYLYGAIAAGLLIICGLLIPKHLKMWSAIVILIAGFAYFGAFEWFRESVRKPYVISQYMYGNGMKVSYPEHITASGLLSRMVFRTGDDGADLFRHSCRSCHTMDGYKALKPSFDGTDLDFIASIIRGTDVMRPRMPEFFGSDEESRMMASHIYKLTDRRSISEIYDLSGLELGEKVYNIRCGPCHVIGGFNDKSESLEGLTKEEYSELLDELDDLAEEMPAFGGDETEKAALIEFLEQLGKDSGGNNAGL